MLNITIYTSIFSQRGRTYAMPEAWNELTGKQLVKLVPILFGDMEPVVADTHSLRILLGMSKWRFNRIDAEVVAEELLPMVAFIRNTRDLTKQLLPVIRCGGTSFYGPADGLGNLRMVEFDFAERELAAYHADNTQHSLFRFIATLYRPGKRGYDHRRNPDGDPREGFNDNLLAYYANILQEDMHPDMARAIMLWYKGCRQQLAEEHPRIFPAAADKSEEQEDKPDEEPALPTYFGLMRTIAEKGTYGNFDQIEQMYLGNALAECEFMMDEQIRLKEEMEKQTRGNNYE
jgi:hypothetical protein